MTTDRPEWHQVEAGWGSCVFTRMLAASLTNKTPAHVAGCRQASLPPSLERSGQAGEAQAEKGEGARLRDPIRFLDV